MKLLHRVFNRTPLRNKLLILFFCFGFLPTILLSLISYSLFSDLLLQNAINNLATEVSKNNELISLHFERIENASLYLTVDPVLREMMNEKKPPSNLEILHGNTALKQVLDRYFMEINGVFSYHLFTDSYLMVGNVADRTASSSKPAMYVPYDKFAGSALYQAAKKANGKIVWVPTYSYQQMYNLPEYQYIDYDYPYLFSAVKQINCLETGNQSRPPVLIVSFKPDFIDGIVLNSDLTAKGAQYYLVSPENRIISACGSSYNEALPDELVLLTDKASGTARTSYVGEESLLAFETLKYSGWKQIIIIPAASYLGSMAAIPNIILFVSLGLIVLMAVAVLFITRRISGNMKTITDGMKELGSGNLDQVLPVPQDLEFGLLAAGFNQMSYRIHSLITENYEINLRQKEAQLMAFNLQMNPHFLYNTLSTINWIAIENGQEEISLALTHLSNMLQRSYKNKSDVFTVEDDLKWLEDYLYIMKLRFEDKFKVNIIIDPELMKTHIPRSMFQPLIENTIIHGFEDLNQGGEIIITGQKLPDHSRQFIVQDNGAGFDHDQIQNILSNDTSGVGLSNLNHRLKALYKENFRLEIATAVGEGTKITITLPPEIE